MGTVYSSVEGCLKRRQVLKEGHKARAVSAVDAQKMSSPLMADGAVPSARKTLANFSLLEYAEKRWPIMVDLMKQMQEEFSTSESFHDFPEFVNEKGKAKLRMELKKQEGTGNYLHRSYQTEEMYCDSAALMFMNINGNYFDSNLENYKVIKAESTSDTIALLSRINTKKILIVQPREFFFFRVIKKISDTHFIDIKQSVDIAEMLDIEDIGEIYRKIEKNFVHSRMNSNEYVNVNGLSKLKWTNELDPMTSIGFTFMKPFANSSVKTCFKEYLKNLEEFYRDRVWEKREQIYWFDENYEELREKFDRTYGLPENKSSNESKMTNAPPSSLRD